MVPFCRRWVQLPAGRHVNMCLAQVWRRVQFTFTSFSIIQFIICVSHPSLTQSSIHFHFLFNYSIRGSYFCVPLNSDTGFNSLSPLKHHLWRGESTQTRNSLMKRVTRVIWEWFMRAGCKLASISCWMSSPITISWPFPTLQRGHSFLWQPHISSFLLIVKRVNKFAHKALSRPAGCRSSNAMSRCFNLHQKCHCQPCDRTWYLYTVNCSQDIVHLVAPSSRPSRVGTLIVAQQSFVTAFELE